MASNSTPIGYYFRKELINGWQGRLNMIPSNNWVTTVTTQMDISTSPGNTIINTWTTVGTSTTFTTTSTHSISGDKNSINTATHSNITDIAYDSSMYYIEIPDKFVLNIKTTGPTDTNLPEGILNILNLDFDIDTYGIYKLATEQGFVTFTDGVIIPYVLLNPIDRSGNQTTQFQLWNFYQSLLNPAVTIDMQFPFTRITTWEIGDPFLGNLGQDTPQPGVQHLVYKNFPNGSTINFLFNRTLYNTWILISDRGESGYSDLIHYYSEGTFSQKLEIEKVTKLDDIFAYKHFKCGDAHQYCFEIFSDSDVYQFLDVIPVSGAPTYPTLYSTRGGTTHAQITQGGTRGIYDYITQYWLKQEQITNDNNPMDLYYTTNSQLIFCEMDYFYQQIYKIAFFILYKYLFCIYDQGDLYSADAYSSDASTISITNSVHPFFYHQFYKQDPNYSIHNYIASAKDDGSDGGMLQWSPNGTEVFAETLPVYLRSRIQVPSSSPPIYNGDPIYFLINYYQATLQPNDSKHYQISNFGGLLSTNEYSNTYGIDVDTSNIAGSYFGIDWELGINDQNNTNINYIQSISNTVNATVTTNSNHNLYQNQIITFTSILNNLKTGNSAYNDWNDLTLGKKFIWGFLIGQQFLVDLTRIDQVLYPNKFNLMYLNKPNLDSINNDTIVSKYKNMWDFLVAQFNSSGGVCNISSNYFITYSIANPHSIEILYRNKFDLFDTSNISNNNYNFYYIDLPTINQRKLTDAEITEQHYLLRGSKSTLENMQSDDDSNPNYIALRSYANEEGNYSIPIWNGFTIPTAFNPNENPNNQTNTICRDFSYPLLARKMYYLGSSPGLIFGTNSVAVYSVSPRLDMMRYKRYYYNAMLYVIDNLISKGVNMYTYLPLPIIGLPDMPVTPNVNSLNENDWTARVHNILQIVQQSSGYGNTLNLHKMRRFSKPDQFLITGKYYLYFNYTVNNNIIFDNILTSIYIGLTGQVVTDKLVHNIFQSGWEDIIIQNFQELENNFYFILLGCDVDWETMQSTVKLFFNGQKDPIL